MQEPARVTFYDIKDFGIFKRGEKQPLFGDLHNILGELGSWAEGKQLGETKTYDQEGSQLPAYFLDVRRKGSAWLLTLWNETPSTDGAVASMSAYANVGNTDVTMNELAEGDIPGFASYFWFLPDQGVVATVRFQHPGAGRGQMNTYLRKFLAYFSSHAVTSLDEETEELVVSGYRQSARHPVVSARARFKLEIHKKEAERQYLLEHANRVRKLKKKALLTLTERTERALWQRLLEAAHMSEPTVRPHEVKILYEVEVSGMTEQDMAGVIDAWEGEDEDNDYGFMMVGETETHWLGHAIAKDSLMLDVLRLNPEIVNPEFLIDELARHRRALLALL